VEIVRLADRIYRRVDFRWMLDGDSNLLSHGWTPEAGFLKYRWDRFSELPLLYLLAIGSPSAPISPAAWYAWQRPSVSLAGFTFVNGAPPLFCQSTAVPDNSIIFGVSAAETPTCDTAGGSINDPYFGTHSYVSGASQSTYQLKWQTGQGAGLANGGNVNAEKQGSAANPIQHMQSMNLPAPGQQSRIDSWAALVE